MCGIVGSVGQNGAASKVVDSLKKLLYRGYDSAGVSGIVAPGEIKIYKQVLPEGQFDDFANKVTAAGFSATCANAIGHTRWATHGGKTDVNAHPHSDWTGKIAIVHNGMLENWRGLKSMLISQGCKIVSDTDSELIAHLFAILMKKTGDLKQSVLEMVPMLVGAYGVLIQHADYPDSLIGIRQGSPMSYAKLNDGSFMIASTSEPLLGYAESYKNLRDGEIIIIRGQEVEELSFRSNEPSSIIIPSLALEGSPEDIGKEGYPHFMLKEIMTQPERLVDVFRGRVFPETGQVKLGGLEASVSAKRKLLRAKHFIFIGSGTSYHACLITARMFRQHLHVHAEAKQASEVVFDDILAGCSPAKTVIFAFSQSGETKDLLVALEHLKSTGVSLVAGVVNVVGSTLVSLTDGAGVYLRVGPEIGVASTKAFSSQVLVGAMITIWLKQQKGTPLTQFVPLVKAITQIPEQLKVVLEQSDDLLILAEYIQKFSSLMILGRGYHYYTALEGGLKVAEVSYLAREVQPAGEMKHGPLALVTEGYPVVMVATQDKSRSAILQNISELKARGAMVIGLVSKGDAEMDEAVDNSILIPEAPPELATILTGTALQLLAYHLGVIRGCNVDQPRNLAKAVTVE